MHSTACFLSVSCGVERAQLFVTTASHGWIGAESQSEDDENQVADDEYHHQQQQTRIRVFTNIAVQLRFQLTLKAPSDLGSTTPCLGCTTKGLSNGLGCL